MFRFCDECENVERVEEMIYEGRDWFTQEEVYLCKSCDELIENYHEDLPPTPSRL